MDYEENLKFYECLSNPGTDLNLIRTYEGSI